MSIEEVEKSVLLVSFPFFHQLLDYHKTQTISGFLRGKGNMTASFSDIRKYIKELVSLATGTEEKKKLSEVFFPTYSFF